MRFHLFFLLLIVLLGLSACGTVEGPTAPAEPPVEIAASESVAEVVAPETPGIPEEVETLEESPELEALAPPAIDFEFITMDRIKPILPSVKQACMDAFLSSPDTLGMTLITLQLSDDEKYLYVEAQGERLHYFAYDITTGTLTSFDPETESPLVLWTNLYQNDVEAGHALANEIIAAYEDFTLNPSLYNTLITLLPFQLSAEQINQVTDPTWTVFPYKEHYCLWVRYTEQNNSCTYQIFCDYEHNVIAKQGYDLSLHDHTAQYYGDLEERMDSSTLTFWEDESVQLTGLVKADPDGRYYLQLSEPVDVVLIEYRERFEGCDRIYFHDDLAAQLNMTISVTGCLSNYRGSGTLYLEGIEITS